MSFLKEKAFINGKWVDAITQAVFAVKNPADNSAFAHVPNCSKDDCVSAIKSASKAFKNWGYHTTAKVLTKERGAFLKKWGSLLLDNKKQLGELLTREQGKTLPEAVNEIVYSASFFEWFGHEARRIYGQIVPPNQLGRQLFHFRQPAGVAAMITPWNFPSAMIARKVAAALAAGCTCVVKPAEDTPLSALALAAIAESAGLPEGVFNVIPSDRSHADAIGRTFCESKDIAVLSFTGSTDVGKLLLSNCSNTVKRVCLELGGNAPFIVFPSADLRAAVKGAMLSKFRCSGQTCVCANRFFVHKDVHDEFLEKLQSAVERELVLGNGLDKGVTQGPLINARAVEKVKHLVEDAVSKGAKIICGGKPQGNFFPPTILTDVLATMEIVKREIFGPVVPIIRYLICQRILYAESSFRFESEDEVIEYANDVNTGLAGYFYSRDVAQIFRVARLLDVGMTGINEAMISTCEAAFGGMKESGLGREAAHIGLEEYTEMKTVCLGGL
ncbi:Succinate-semialdehyde dehydrogenase, mitochondri al [Trichuris trichiura]|uniref:Succinate-semialdehyde dehydrogenase, mitochondrial n=1 Tax=Trichuris trichiura TaxID=36087 RepID=A0A077Z029_TRITR|nr:Succinate-semialdehyde dehydrogenase, mitochondri al [Trichuris trichiura]